MSNTISIEELNELYKNFIKDRLMFDAEIVNSFLSDVHEFIEIKSAQSTIQPDTFTAYGWIKCSDRLPEDGQSILTFNEAKLAVTGRYAARNKPVFFNPWDNSIIHLVTHWQPLPAPPTEFKPKS